MSRQTLIIAAVLVALAGNAGADRGLYSAGPLDMNGGGTYSTSAHYAVSHTSGQPGGVGPVASAHYALDDGFQYAAFYPDCNANGVSDEIDIASGTSQDCNGNGIPDECEAGLGPTITQQPLSETVSVPRPATFTVQAAGLGTLSYHWRKGGQPLTDDGRISGATTVTLRIDPTWMSDSGSYNVMVTDDCGPVTSTPATLTVTACPGDMNCDGRVTFADIDPFVLALTSWGVYLQHYPNCDIMLADINRDGYVTFADIDPFVAVIGRTCP